MYAFRLDLLSLGLPYLARNTEFVLFRNVILLDFPIDCTDYGRRQFNPQDEGVDEVEQRVERDAIRVASLAFRTLHHLLAQHGLRPPANLVLNFGAFCRVDVLSSVFCDDFTHSIADFRTYQRLYVARSDRLMKLGDGLTLEPIADVDGCAQADPVSGNRIIGLCR